MAPSPAMRIRTSVVDRWNHHVRQEFVSRQEGPQILEWPGHHRPIWFAHRGEAWGARLFARRHDFDDHWSRQTEQLTHPGGEAAVRIDSRVCKAVRLHHTAQRRQRDAARRISAGEAAEVTRL